jgi:manganese/iron transport system substrate-binding protein
MSRWVILAAVLGAVVAGGCSTNKPAGSADQRHGRILRVVATTTQVADFARNVGGDRVQVTSLLKPNLDAHDYEPSPADVEAIARADLVVENGAGLESWLHDTISSSGFDGPVVDTSQGVRLRQVGGATDPHIWQNPRNAEVMVANIERALAAVDPADAGVFRANLAGYTKQLQALDAGVQRQIDSLANKKLVTNHDAFGYYVDRYGLQFVARSSPASTARPSSRAATSPTWSPRSGRPRSRRSSPRPRCRPGRPRRSLGRPGSRSWRARAPCMATRWARPGPTATPTSR